MFLLEGPRAATGSLCKITFYPKITFFLLGLADGLSTSTDCLEVVFSGIGGDSKVEPVATSEDQEYSEDEAESLSGALRFTFSGWCL